MLDTKEYLAKVLPWPQDGDPPAYINIHWSTNKLNQKGKPFWSGRAVRSIGEAVSTVQWALSLSDVKDIYVCMSSQREAKELTSKAGNKYLLPVRAQEGVVALKSLYMDIDAKGGDKNSYDTLEEAVDAFTDFVTAIDLPEPSVIVKTGGGLHVYWTFDRALTIAEWQPLSNALAAAIKAHGFRCDTGCTIDAARVLRIPGTFNRKLDVRRPVVLAGGRVGYDYVLARLERALDPFKTYVTQPKPSAPATPRWASVLPQLTPIMEQSDLSAGVEQHGPPTELADLMGVCPFVREAVTSGGKDFANPLWNLTTLIATFTDGGRIDAHLMGRKHPTYDRASTDDLYDRKENDRKSKGLGWPACSTISNSGYGGCLSCPHLSAGRTPFHAAAAQSAATLRTAQAQAGSSAGTATLSIQSDLPKGYIRRSDGVVAAEVTLDDGSIGYRPVLRYPVDEAFLQNGASPALNFTAIISGKGKPIMLPSEALRDKNTMAGCLLKQGVFFQEEENKNVRRFLMSWIQQLQTMKERNRSSVPFGWSIDAKGAVEGFAFDGILWSPNGGNRSTSSPDPEIARRYRPIGTVDPWIAAAKLITDQKRPALDAIVASAFAAPLIKFCHEPGVLMSTYSARSGIGKTTAMKVAQAVWGHPITSMHGLTDTENAVLRKTGQLQSLPLYWDELKTEHDNKRFVNLAFSLTRQKEKDRLSQSVTMRESGSWETMLVSASNESILNYIVEGSKQSAAGIYRVFEYEVPAAVNGVGQINQADASRIIGRLNNNHSHVGLQYARYLGSNHAAIEKEVEEFYKDIGDEIKVENEERYWRTMLASLLMGAEYANRLGFTDIDMPALKKFLLGVVGEMRDEKDTQPVDLEVSINVSNIMAQFFKVMQAKRTLRTNLLHTSRGKPTRGSITIKNLRADNLDAIAVHVGEDNRLIRVSKNVLQSWLKTNEFSVSNVMKALAEQCGTVTVQGRLGSGTEYVGLVEYLIEIDLKKNPEFNFIDEA